MTLIKVTYNQSHQIMRLWAQGHTGLKKAPHDILCAAVSSLMFTLIESGEKLVHPKRLSYTIKQEETLIEVVNREPENHDLQLLFQSTLLGLKLLVPGKEPYLKIEEKIDE
jgi:uncharacterized protein YsxB (DUF464 family)